MHRRSNVFSLSISLDLEIYYFFFFSWDIYVFLVKELSSEAWRAAGWASRPAEHRPTATLQEAAATQHVGTAKEKLHKSKSKSKSIYEIAFTSRNKKTNIIP